MNTPLTAKAYYVFMFMLPLIFYPGITDTVLLPRQLFLSAFTVLLFVFVWKINRIASNSVEIGAAHLSMIIYFIVAAVISAINALVFSEAIYVLSKLGIVITFSILTVMLLKQDLITTKHLIIAVVIFGCVSVALTLFDLLGKSIRGQHLMRAVHIISAGFGNKNLLSSILFLCIPFFMLGIQRRRPLRLISGIALILTLVLLVILRTRIALIATLVFFGIVACFYLKNYLRKRSWLFIAALVTLAVALFLTLRSYDMFGKPQSAGDVARQYFNRLLSTETLEERILFWRNSLQMFGEHPFGVGLGNWQVYFPKYGLDKFDTYGIINGLHTLQRPHNDFIWSLCETGVLGFIAYLSIFVIVIYKSAVSIKSATSNNERWISIYLFAGVVGFIIISFFDFPAERIEHLVLLMLIFSLIIYRYDILKPERPALSVRPVFMMSFLVMCVGLSIAVASSRFVSEQFVYKMDAAKKNGFSEVATSFGQKAETSLYKVDSRTIPLQWYQGVAKYSKQQYAESELCFEKAYGLTPYNIHVINNLASCYEVNGNRKDAIRFYQKALKISPRFEEARLNLAAVYFNNNEFDRAFATIDSCSLQAKDPKYKMFLPPILKSKAGMVLSRVESSVASENMNKLKNLQDYLEIYYESKRNNITFEQQIIRQLKH